MTVPGTVDVLVIGGGPAGATVATLVAKAGHRVLLVERSAEPRFKIGESLMPATYWTFERLGLLERMAASRFPVKQSVQFVGASGRASRPFYFHENDPHPSSSTWQVLRSEFDELLLDNAADHGAEVRRGVAARAVRFADGRAAGARLENADGEAVEVAARVVVDATGQSSLVARALGLREVDPCLRQVAFFSHWTGARRDDGVDEGATIIYHTEGKRAWFWFIPLPDDRVSVGVVGPVDHLIAGRPADPGQVLSEELERCPALAERLVGAERALPVSVLRDFSYRTSRFAGDGWVLTGDALGFIDPIYSTGVFLALASGEMAADSIVAALAADDPSAARLGRFEPTLRRGMESFRRLVYAFYDPEFSFGRFLERHPARRSDLVHLLVGNVFRVPMEPLMEALDETMASLRPGRDRELRMTSSE